ncbi:hypothetical protein ACFL2K_04840 [Candidatus Margulisiibacteriota bacterium]
MRNSTIAFSKNLGRNNPFKKFKTLSDKKKKKLGNTIFNPNEKDTSFLTDMYFSKKHPINNNFIPKH